MTCLPRIASAAPAAAALVNPVHPPRRGRSDAIALATARVDKKMLGPIRSD